MNYSIEWSPIDLRSDVDIPLSLDIQLNTTDSLFAAANTDQQEVFGWPPFCPLACCGGLWVAWALSKGVAPRGHEPPPSPVSASYGLFCCCGRRNKRERLINVRHRRRKEKMIKRGGGYNFPCLLCKEKGFKRKDGASFTNGANVKKKLASYIGMLRKKRFNNGVLQMMFNEVGVWDKMASIPLFFFKEGDSFN